MSGISVKNSWANCSLGDTLHITVKHRPTVLSRFHSRMEAVVGANGDYFLIEWYIMPMTFIFFYFHKI
jgi:hypothetical protein